MLYAHVNSGAGTNLKVGGPVWSESGGIDPSRNAVIFFGCALPLFWLSKHN